MSLYNFKLFFLSLFIFFSWFHSVYALEPGTLLFRTSSQGKMYGYNSQDLIVEKSGVITNVYSGHAAIYIGKEDGIDYVVEALGTGIVKTPAQYFINESQGEKLVAAKLPIKATVWQRAKAVALAKYLASADLAYDFDFSSQKGPWSGDWTCVGLTEKVYESANANNPERLGALEYNPQYYAVDITPDGYDKISIYNDQGDCFSTKKEFSKIARRKNTILPAPEIIGYNAGKEYQGDRYIFLPYTQALQATLKDVPVDIKLSSSFPEEAIRGKVNNLGLILKWSLINNPVSSLKKVATTISNGFNSLFNKNDKALVWNETSNGSFKVDSQLDSDSLMVNKKPIVNQANNNENQEMDSSFNNTTPNSNLVSANNYNNDTASKINTSKTKKSDNTNLNTDVFSTFSPSLNIETKEKDVEEEVKVPIKISSSSIAISNNQSQATSKPKTNTALWSPVVQNLTTSTSSTNTNNSATTTNNNQTQTNNQNNNSNQTNQETEELALTLVISRLYTEGNDDWLEIWNYGEQDIDLAERKIRLEKSKTALDPGIILRFDSNTDAQFLLGTIIPAGSFYRIVRDDASSELKAAASAIALRSDFTFTDSGYTLYLAKGAVSSPDDDDIIDVLGYGAAKYFEGSGPAPALTSGHLLRRKAVATTKLADILNNGEQKDWPPIYDNDDNAHDFLLWPLGGVLPTNNEEGNNNQEEENNNNNNNENNYENNNNSNNNENNNDKPFTLQPGLNSSGLQYLWSFSECEGTSTADMISHKNSSALLGGGQWAVGRWGCGRYISYNGAEIFQAHLAPVLSGSNFSFAFQYKGNDDYSHPYFVFKNTLENISLRFEIFAGMFSFSGFPGLDGRYDANGHMDNNWHQGVLVWNAAGGYWALYIDGQEMFWQNFTGLGPDFDYLEIGAYAGLTIIDDLALWNRALSQEEIITLYQAKQPFNPQISREEPPNLKLLHFWQFDEASGQVAHDEVGSIDWSLPQGALVYNGFKGKALSFPPIGSVYNLTIPKIKTNNFSASWWWQNNATLPYSGRLHLDFKQDDNKLVSLALDNWQQRLWTERNGEFFQEGDTFLPGDNLWHHLALVYDDYRYRWQLFVDGQLKVNLESLPLPPGANINNLVFRSSVSDYKIDNFKLWQGSLSTEDILTEYHQEKNN